MHKKYCYYCCAIIIPLVVFSSNNINIVAATAGENANDKPDQLAYTINSELQVIEKKIETYKQLVELETKKAKVLEKIRAEVMEGNKVIGKRDGQLETTWTIEEISQHVLQHELTNMHHSRRFGGRYAAPLLPRKKPIDLFYEVFVKRNEISLYDNEKIIDIDVLAIPFRGGYSGSRRKKRGSSYSLGQTTPNINLIIVTDSSSKITLYDGESGNQIMSHQTKHGVNQINQTLCSFNVYDAYCATVGVDGQIYVHAFTVYMDQKYLSGKRIVIPQEYQARRSSEKKINYATIPSKEEKETNNEAETSDDLEATEQKTKQENVNDYAHFPSQEGLWVKLLDDDVLIDVDATFQTADEKLGYIVEHATMGRTRLFVVGNANGNVALFWRNGSSYFDRIFNVNPNNTPIHAIATSRSFTAVSKGKAVVFLNLGRQTIMKHECHGGLTDITNMVFDHLSAQIMYAASVDGDIFVFNTRTRSKHSGLICKLMYKLRTNTTYASTLYQRKGYLIATSNNEMNVYNTSNVLKKMPYLISTHAFQNAIPRMSIPSTGSSSGGGGGWFGSHSSKTATGKAKDHEILSSISVLPHDKVPGETLFAILLKNTNCDSNGGGSKKEEVCGTNVISLFTTLLKYEPPVYDSSDITWLRTPLMALGVIGVFLYQFMGKRRGGGGGGGGMPDLSGFGRRGGLSGNEMGNLRNIINRYEKQNGGAGNADAFMRSMERSGGFRGGGSRRRDMMGSM